ncbi:hypothetical protein [Propioniciclava tarda]|uniref:Aromatic ring-opening dioxygenase LigA n=1 Tax=Propioniciclava tarda TaxID=433330 RepID=A0A4Q9KP21_PROTD|nr:hypothetical protein [Propioniciclava tarda]TBT95579.1 hypothetical protein ET996_03755 [Propioniciclava tarda]SMO48498.1 hypothetical protein SAMN06266982_103198 [Propioniciclava tarda]HOA89407.1 hypothetical protein [Propioniciclava tarda]HQA31491.1 hypothetical protein [Propioniciclava tarda]HQD61194.1 hypothetical protein [Propioniciclava tarda]
MLRSTFDRLVSYVGLLIAAVLLVVAGLAFWGQSFATGTVRDQLAAQRITMPVAAAMAGLSDADKAALTPFAGQPLDNGDAAKAYADHYIQAHMNASSGGKTYAEVSGVCNAAKKADPTMAQDATKQACDLRETLFMGDTLRSMLLTAYAFGTIGKIAFWGFVATGLAGLGMLVLSVLGLGHARRAGEAVVGAPVVIANRTEA